MKNIAFIASLASALALRAFALPVADELQNGTGATNPAPGMIVFDGPKADGGGGAKGVLYQNTVTGNGSTWTFQHKRSKAGYSTQIIHPLGRGQAIVHLNREDVCVTTTNSWKEIGYLRGAGSNNDARVFSNRGPAFSEIFPLQDDVAYEVVSRMGSDGKYEMAINGKLVSQIQLRAPEEPLSVENAPDERFTNCALGGGRQFSGEGLPLKWATGWAAVFVCPQGKQIVSSLQFYPASIPLSLIASPSPAAPAATAPAATAPGIVRIAVADVLQAKGVVSNPAPGTVVFDGPPGDGRRSSKGILLKAPRPEPGAGSTWAFQYSRVDGAFPLQIIHPFGGGQIIIHLNSTIVGLSTPVKWTDVGYRNGDNRAVQRTSAYAEVFPLKPNTEYQVVSRLSTDGAYEMVINGKLVATAFLDTPSSSPLSLEIPPGTKFAGQGRGELIFRGSDLPMQWSAGWAALFVGPIDGAWQHRCSAVVYYANYIDPDLGTPVAIPRRPNVAAGDPAAPGAEADELTKLILGDWIKYGGEKSGVTITINTDGTIAVDGKQKFGSWKWVNKEQKLLEVTHNKGDAYALTLSEEGRRATGQFVRAPDAKKIGTPVEYVRKGVMPSLFSGAGLANSPPPALPATSPKNASAPLSASDLVKTHRSNLVFVTMEGGAGSGFIANYGNGTYLITNAHVAAGAKGAVFKSLDGVQVEVGAPAVAVGHDIFLMALKQGGNPIPVMTGVDENATIGDDVVVLGNAEGAGVINTITGKIVGIGPNLVEVSAPFQPGNSGSPIIHLKTGKVIGVATYAIIRKYDSATKQPVKEPIVRRFGYRLDSVKKWEPVTWQSFNAQAAEIDSAEKLTKDLVTFLQDLSKDGTVNRGAHNNPAIKTRVDQWIDAKSRRLSARDSSMADQSLLSFLKVTCQSDITAAQQRITYDYFRRQLDEQQKERTEIASYFGKIIESLRQER